MSRVRHSPECEQCWPSYAGHSVDRLVSQIPIHATFRPARPAPPRPARTTATLPNVQCRPPGFPAYVASSPHTNYCCLALRQVGLVPEVSIKAPPSMQVSPSDQWPCPPLSPLYSDPCPLDTSAPHRAAQHPCNTRRPATLRHHRHCPRTLKTQKFIAIKI